MTASALIATSDVLRAGLEMDDIITIAVLLLYVLPNVISAIRKRLAPEGTAQPGQEGAPAQPQPAPRTTPPSQLDPLELLRRRLAELSGEMQRRQEVAPPPPPLPTVAPPAPAPAMIEERPQVVVDGPVPRPAASILGNLSVADMRTAIVTRAALLQPVAQRATPWRRRI